MSRVSLTMTVPPPMRTALEGIASACDQFVPSADFQTGSVSLAAMAYLRLLCERFHPATIIEIGTFIGKSTSAMLSEPSVQHVYSCDMHNDCLQNSDRLTCFPLTTSTAMLGQVMERGVKADLFFFDGRLSPSDVPLVLRLSKWNTVYVFDDYHENPPGEQFPFGKGVFNLSLLEPFLPEHVFIEPPEQVGDVEGWTTIAVLLPKELV